VVRSPHGRALGRESPRRFEGENLEGAGGRGEIPRREEMDGSVDPDSDFEFRSAGAGGRRPPRLVVERPDQLTPIWTWGRGG
jgi:hypothetical protein